MPQHEVSAIPGPGWYADGNNALRWWDGQTWTEHVAEASPVVAQGPASQAVLPTQPVPHRHAPTATTGSGVSALAVIAIAVCWLPYIGAAGLLLGILALREMKTSGKKGRIPAIIAITFGGLWALDLLLGLVAAVLRAA